MAQYERDFGRLKPEEKEEEEEEFWSEDEEELFWNEDDETDDFDAEEFSVEDAD